MHNCYVYILYDKFSIPRYVGMGRRNRISSLDGRDDEYINILNDDGKLEKVAENLNVLSAIEIERDYIDKYKDTLINKVSGNVYNNLYWKELSSLFYLDESSPSGIRWLKDRINISKTIKAREGDIAGSLGKQGYWTVPFKGKYLKAHRIVYSLYHKIDILSPDIIVNHIDGNRQNNNILNLELCSHRDNSIRATRFPRCTSGHVGVSKYTKRGVVHWKAKIQVSTGNEISKSFSSNKYGYDEAYTLACKWRKQMEELYYK